MSAVTAQQDGQYARARQGPTRLCLRMRQSVNVASKVSRRAGLAGRLEDFSNPLRYSTLPRAVARGTATAA